MADTLAEILGDIRTRNPYRLAGDDLAGPDSLSSPGADWLIGVRDAFVEAVEYAAEGDDLLAEVDDRIHELADSAVEVYTHRRWLVFTDLCMWNVDIEDLASGRGDIDMTELAGLAQYVAAENLSRSLLDEIREAIEAG